MMQITTGAPANYSLGLDDKSKARVVIAPDQVPTHCPKVYIRAKWGPTDPMFLSTNFMETVYGADTFDYKKKWTNHQTALLKEAFIANANACVVQRVIPGGIDTMKKSTLRIYVDLLEADADFEIERDDAGNFKYNNDGTPVKTATALNVNKVAFIAKMIEGTVVDGAFGAGKIIDGNQVDNRGDVSKMYPIRDLEVPYYGSHGDNFGIRMWSDNELTNPQFDTTLINHPDVGCYPVNTAIYTRSDKMATASIMKNNYGETQIETVLKADVYNPRGGRALSHEKRVIDDWADLNQAGMPNLYYGFGKCHVYQNNLELVLSKLATLEATTGDAADDLDIDYTGDPASESYQQFWRMNLLGLTASSGKEYQTARFAIFRAVPSGYFRPGPNTTVYASGGTEHSFDNASYEEQVVLEVTRYNDVRDNLMDDARNVESYIYDSGFTFDTKLKLPYFISQRKDTYVFLSVNEAGEFLSASDESSRAAALQARLSAMPESDYFGTPVYRGSIIGRSGDLIGSTYRGDQLSTSPLKARLPITIEVAAWMAKAMGASNGVWDKEAMFDENPNNVIKMFTNINATFTPVSVRNIDWKNGLTWVQTFNLSSCFIPAIQTCYDDDTSVVNSCITAACAVSLQRIGQQAWRHHVGMSGLTNDQFLDRINKWVSKQAPASKYASRFIIEPNAYMTEDDLNRAYAWHLAIRLAAPSMKTVQQLSLETYRIESYQSIGG